MSSVRLDDCTEEARPSGLNGATGRLAAASAATGQDMSTALIGALDRRAGPRRTPRMSLIVVLPENHIVSSDRLAQLLPGGSASDVDIIVACAGQPAHLGLLHRTARNAQFLLAPAGTSEHDLRELAMSQAPGDIVKLLSGAPVPATSAAERELLQTS